ncbi:uncharacterized Rho GTPase-activating protein isoform X1, partial [Tanacetum coccineum]
EESVALKELRLNTLRFMQCLICRDGEKDMKKTAQKSKTLSTDIEGWEKGVARTNVFGVPLEVTVLRQDSTKPVPFILVKFAVFLVLSGLKLKTKVESLLYNHTLTRTMVEYASTNYLQAFVGVADDLNAIVIAFRGTQETSIHNWIEDLF